MAYYVIYQAMKQTTKYLSHIGHFQQCFSVVTHGCIRAVLRGYCGIQLILICICNYNMNIGQKMTKIVVKCMCITITSTMVFTEFGMTSMSLENFLTPCQ